VTVVIDAGPLVAFGDANDPYFARIDQLLRSLDGPLVIPAPVTAEVDYLLGQRLGHGPRRQFIADLAAGRFTVACLEREDYATIGELDARYADLALGLADCALVVVARRYRTNRIMSFDERHFRAVSPLDGGAFTILPADS
jgi:predicted nucleic acid-binding protein